MAASNYALAVFHKELYGKQGAGHRELTCKNHLNVFRQITNSLLQDNLDNHTIICSWKISPLHFQQGALKWFQIQSDKLHLVYAAPHLSPDISDDDEYEDQSEEDEEQYSEENNGDYTEEEEQEENSEEEEEYNEDDDAEFLSHHFNGLRGPDLTYTGTLDLNEEHTRRFSSHYFAALMTNITPKSNKLNQVIEDVRETMNELRSSYERYGLGAMPWGRFRKIYHERGGRNDCADPVWAYSFMGHVRQMWAGDFDAHLWNAYDEWGPVVINISMCVPLVIRLSQQSDLTNFINRTVLSLGLNICSWARNTIWLIMPVIGKEEPSWYDYNTLLMIDKSGKCSVMRYITAYNMFPHLSKKLQKIGRWSGSYAPPTPLSLLTNVETENISFQNYRSFMWY